MSKSNTIIISICIPTYRRPDLLDRCLKAIEEQYVNDFQFEVVVVDNDKNHSARAIVAAQQKLQQYRIRYISEPVQNISIARNLAVSESIGDFIAFIDDDEFPEPHWLMKLLNTCNCFSVDGVLGPVIPHFVNTPPVWLVKSGLCLRESFPTGTCLNNPKYMRTGNVLFNRQIINGITEPFESKLGLTGGEDTLFFSTMLQKGYNFCWCNEASVYEAVPLERQTKRYYIRRDLMRGVNTARSEHFFSKGTVKSFFALAIYTLIMPFLLLAGQHMVMKYLVKICNHLSKLLAHIGINLSRERRF